MTNNTSDQSIREKAIDPSGSFIVQAPAGSGKTELLTQRFLQLLAHAEKNPEEVIAITFTNKAAAEMRQRIVDALTAAQDAKPPAEEHKQITWKLARNALARSESMRWHLHENPNRLRVLTFDALAAFLVRQMPLSSKLNTQLAISDKPHRYYREAIHEILIHSNLEPLLLHLDNRIDLLENLLIKILEKREQWLPHIIQHTNSKATLRNHLEKSLQQITLEQLDYLKRTFPAEILELLMPLAHKAAASLLETDPSNPICACAEQSMLDPHIDHLTSWQGIAHLLLTQKGEWRKSLTKNQGFPAKSPHKAACLALLGQLQNNETLRTALDDLLACPPLHYQNDQWIIIESLIQLLPKLAAELSLIFSREGVVDFVELNLAAHRALGDEEIPSDLALQIDYQIRHLLVDEFQDTSILQFQLIKRLVAGWTPNDNRTLFIVGDPMQSIYRFRNAEVGLFLYAQQYGIGDISLTSLALTQNFRSFSQIVDWNNQRFHTIFPAQANINQGAVPYSPAQACITGNGDVRWHCFFDDEGHQEAIAAINLIKLLQQENPEDSLAILVRSRSHLTEIIKQLHQHTISFQAVELEPLGNLPEIQDIHTLSRALLHRADRTSWLSLLRAPFCGLLLDDLTYIAQAASKHSIWTTLKNFQAIEALSQDARIRLAHLVPALHNAIASEGRLLLSERLNTLWQNLHGSSIYSLQQNLHVQQYSKLLERIEEQNPLITLNDIEERLATLYAEPQANASIRLQIMTIHKAKGLEFDHVLLAGLERKPAADSSQLLKWLERPNGDLILAPIKAADVTTDSVYQYLHRLDQRKLDLEQARLLYVATTRAKKSLHLFANVTTSDNEINQPTKRSFLSLMWENAKPIFESKLTQTQKENAELHHDSTDVTIETNQQTLMRVHEQFLSKQTIIPPISMTHSAIPSLHLSNNTPRALGIVLHECLENLSNKKFHLLSQRYYIQRLQALGIKPNDQKEILNTLEETLEKVKLDPRAQWILGEQKAAQSEWQLTYLDEDGIPHQIVIDRSFIDEEGNRWIIDYKTGANSEMELENHLKQLNTYAKALILKESRPIRLALYFPLTSDWIEYEYAQ